MEEWKRNTLNLFFVLETDLLQLLLLDEANSNLMVPSIWYPFSLIYDDIIWSQTFRSYRTFPCLVEQERVSLVSEATPQPCTSQQVEGRLCAHMGGKPDILLVAGTSLLGNEDEGTRGSHHILFRKTSYQQ
jgi:hypothetical protein